jgi:hypothetical protein
VTAGRASGDESVHYRFHFRVLAPLRPGIAALDGIVVPASRPASNLLPALRLGVALDVPVVVICSRGAAADAVLAVAGGVPDSRHAVVDLAAGKALPQLPPFATAGFASALVGSHGDLHIKRNLGLLLSRAAGWRTLLFLDDDISGLRPGLVKWAVGALDHHAAVGLRALRFADNSVVCHARRFIPGVRQSVFVSGSALAVRADLVDSFFPEVYNEDWLFLAPYLDQRAVAAAGDVHQSPYDPFELPDRATAEEFGDVLGEGLIGHLHHGTLSRPPTVSYWDGFLRRRARFISDAIAACDARATEDPRARKALRSLRRAENARAKIRAEQLTDYVTAWLDDLRHWRHFLTGVPRLGTLQAALDWLGPSVVPAPTSPLDAEPRPCPLS